MSKRVVLLSILVGGVILAVAATSTVWAKAHVPLGRAQICTSSGQVRNIAARVLTSRLAGGACRLTACVFNDVDNGTLVKQFIFLAGDDCDPTDADGDGFCDATGAPSDIPKRLNAVNVTPACSDPF